MIMFCFFQELNISFCLLSGSFLYSVCCYVYDQHAYKTEHVTRLMGYHSQAESQVFFFFIAAAILFFYQKKTSLIRIFGRTVAIHNMRTIVSCCVRQDGTSTCTF